MLSCSILRSVWSQGSEREMTDDTTIRWCIKPSSLENRTGGGGSGRGCLWGRGVTGVGSWGVGVFKTDIKKHSPWRPALLPSPWRWAALSTKLSPHRCGHTVHAPWELPSLRTEHTAFTGSLIRKPAPPPSPPPARHPPGERLPTHWPTGSPGATGGESGGAGPVSSSRANEGYPWDPPLREDERVGDHMGRVQSLAPHLA